MAKKLASFGIIGAAVSALCCFTPLLPWVLGALGLNGLLAYVYRDAVLFPLLAAFLVLTGVAIWRQRRSK